MANITTRLGAGLICVAMLLATGNSPALGATLHWDGTDTTADADGGAGTWDNAATNWDDAATAGADTAWADNDDAVLGGVGDTITVAAAIVAGDINFAVAGYTLDVADGQSLSVNSLSGVGGTITSANAGGTRDITIDNAADVSWAGAIGTSAANRVKLIKNGAGTFGVANIRADRGVEINDGTLQLIGGNTGDGNNNANTVMTGNAVLDLNGNKFNIDGIHSSSTTTRIINSDGSSAELSLNSSTSVFDGTVEGNVSIRVSNSTAVLRLTNAANSFTGGITLGGSVEIFSVAALGTGQLKFNGTVNLYSIDDTDQVIANGVNFTGGAAGGYAFGQTSGDTGELTFTANTSGHLGNRARTFTTHVNTSFAHRFSGDNRNTITKNGDATLTFNGDSTYSGTTTVTAGTLLVMNTSGSGTGDGSVLVNAGGRLGGTGAIAPGSGNLVDFSGGGTFLAMIAGALDIDGDITATGGAIATDDVLVDTEYIVLTHGSGLLSGMFTVDPSISGQGYSVVYDDTAVKLVIPEPATMCLMVFGGLAMAFRGRRA